MIIADPWFAASVEPRAVIEAGSLRSTGLPFDHRTATLATQHDCPACTALRLPSGLSSQPRQSGRYRVASQAFARGTFFADRLSHAMTVGEQVAETQSHRPTEQHGDERAAGQFICNAVGQPCLGPGGLEFMPVNPLRERTVDLLVYEQPILLIGCVERNPTEETNAELHARAGLDAAGSADHPHRRERRRQLREGVLPFVEAKDLVYRCIDEDTFDESGHVFSLPAHWSSTRRGRSGSGLIRATGTASSVRVIAPPGRRAQNAGEYEPQAQKLFAPTGHGRASNMHDTHYSRYPNLA
jgi:hypothetical protein